jgi:hypothetical protein
MDIGASQFIRGKYIVSGTHFRFQISSTHVRGTQIIVADSILGYLGPGIQEIINVASGSVTILLLTLQENECSMEGQDTTLKTIRETLKRGDQRHKLTFK